MVLHIISPLRTTSHEIAWIELNTNAGNFIIQNGHAPMLLILSSQKEVIFKLKNGKDESLIVAQGVAEITREQTTLIINE